MVYTPPTKLSRIGKKVRQKFMVTTEFEIDEYTAGEGAYYARDIKRELQRSKVFEDVDVVEVGRRK